MINSRPVTFPCLVRFQDNGGGCSRMRIIMEVKKPHMILKTTGIKANSSIREKGLNNTFPYIVPLITKKFILSLVI